MESHPTISGVELPKPPLGHEGDARWTKLAEKFRALRLQSLKIAPAAFASTYEAESQRGLDQTFDRLSNQKARQFVAVENDSSGRDIELGEEDVDDLCEREWVGMLVLLGPMQDAVTAKSDPFRSIPSGQAGDCETLETESERQENLPAEFVLNGVFVEPAVRGRGVGKALVDTALHHAERIGGASDSDIFVTVLVNAENEQARQLYERASFAVVGEERYVQEPRALLGEVHRAERAALKMRLDLT